MNLPEDDNQWLKHGAVAIKQMLSLTIRGVKKLGNYDFYGLYSPNIRVIEWRLRWAVHMAHMGVRRCAYSVWWRDLRERDHLEDLVIKGMTLLKWILKTWEWEAWTGLIRREPVSFPGRTLLCGVISDWLCSYSWWFVTDDWFQFGSGFLCSYSHLSEQWVELNFPCPSMTSYGSWCSPSLHNTEISFFVSCLYAKV